MRKRFAVALSATLAGGLAFAALGAGAIDPVHRASFDDGATRAKATGKYEGRFKGETQNGSVIRVKAKVANGEVVKVKSMRYIALMDCATSGETGGEAGWRFIGGIPVNARRKFKSSGTNGQTPESTYTFKGKFSSNFKKVKGTFRTHQWFEAQADPPLPAEYCDLEPTRYVARR